MNCSFNSEISIFSDSTIYDVIRNRNTENDIALVQEEQSTTFGQLFHLADQIADSLKVIGKEAGDMILAQILSTVEGIALLLACSKTGIGVMMLTEFAGGEMIKNVTETYEIDTIFMMEKFFINIASNDYVDCFQKIVLLPIEKKQITRNLSGSNFMGWNQFLNLADEDVRIESVKTGVYPLSICFSSGSSGNPKGIVQSNRSVCNLIRMWDGEEHGWNRGDGYACIFPIYVTSGQSFNLFLPLANGMRVFLNTDSGMEAFTETLKKKKPEVFLLIKFAWLQLLEYCENDNTSHDLDFSNLKAAYSVGAALKGGEEERINAFLRKHGSNTQVTSLYGMSETNSVLMTAQKIENKRAFRPVNGIRTNIIHPITGIPLEKKQIGELLFLTPAIMDGYLLNAEKTEEVFFTDQEGTRWFRSGDCGYADEDNTIILIGRNTDKLTDGDKVCYYYQILDALEKNQYVKDACVCTPANSLVVILNKDIDCSQNRALELIMQQLEADDTITVLPEKVFAVEKFPISPGGKINYGELKELAGNIPKWKG